MTDISIKEPISPAPSDPIALVVQKGTPNDAIQNRSLEKIVPTDPQFAAWVATGLDAALGNAAWRDPGDGIFAALGTDTPVAAPSGFTAAGFDSGGEPVRLSGLATQAALEALEEEVGDLEGAIANANAAFAAIIGTP